jgi:glycosyltransferase involved in cell wall biosynthesis
MNAMRDGPRIWMDITTTIRSQGINGTTRVVNSLAEELGKSLGERLAFCSCSPLGLSPATYSPPLPDAASAREPRKHSPGAKKPAANRFGRRLERQVRHYIRSNLKRLSSRASRDPFPAASQRDCLFLPGETWGARYNFELLASLRARHGVRTAALCQDLIPVTDPQFFESEDFVARFRSYVDFLLYDTDVVIAISKSTARELERLRSPSRRSTRIEVVTLGSDFSYPRSSQSPDFAPDLASRPFALSVSTIQARKNFDLLYRTWRRLTAERKDDCPRLVIAGQRGFGSDDLLWQIAHDPLTKDSIRILHDTTDAELNWLYQHCRFTLYPSFAEGWGLPISESLHRGKICIASNTTSMPEAGQNLCILLDPIDAPGWHDAIVSMIDDPARISALESDIRTRYRPKSWAEAAEDVSQILAGLVSS